MKMKEETRKLIEKEYSEFKDRQYGQLTKEERKKLNAIYTPPEITCEMIDRLVGDDGFGDRTVLDPACGSGNLLVACILAGAKPQNVYGNEISPEMVMLCRERLAPYGVPYHNIHVGDGLDEYCLTVFGPEYEWPKKTNALF